MKPTILVVEDDEDLRKALQEALSARYDVVEARDGYDALSEIIKGRRKYDLIISDLHMPRFNGPTFIEHVEEDTPVIIISAYLDQPLFRDSLAHLKPAAVLEKPFSLSCLSKAIRDALVQRSPGKFLPHILVIDDDAAIRASVGKMLREFSCEVLEASNGRKGFEMCACIPVDVVITDIMMPEMDGIELICKLRREFPDLKIIAMSERGLDYLSMAEDLGASCTIKKPFTSREILEAVGDIVSQ